MKKIYLYAGMSLLLVACSTDTMTNEVTKTQYLEQMQRTDNPLVLIETIERACVSKSYQNGEELINYIERIAFAEASFRDIVRGDYIQPTVDELNYIVNTDVENAIRRMDYSEITTTR